MEGIRIVFFQHPLIPLSEFFSLDPSGRSMHSAFLIDPKISLQCNSHTIRTREESRYGLDLTYLNPSSKKGKKVGGLSTCSFGLKFDIITRKSILTRCATLKTVLT
jgi:hypothetical protein